MPGPLVPPVVYAFGDHGPSFLPPLGLYPSKRCQDHVVKRDWTTALVTQSELSFARLRLRNFFCEFLVGQPFGFIERHQNQVFQLG